MVKKSGLILLFIIVAALAGGVIYVKTNLNSIVKSALEKYGSQVTQTDVTIKNVDIELASGKGTVTGFKIGNPKSFFAATAIGIGSLSLQLDTSSVTGNGPIVINEIDIEKPQVIYEVNAAGNNNLQTLQQNIGSSSGASGKAGTSSGGAPSRKVIIKNLYIRDGEVGVTHALLAGKEVKADLPLIHLTNIGENGSGATPQQVAAKILSEVSKSAAQSGDAALRKALPSIKNLTGGAAKDAKDTVKNSVGKLFGN